MRDSGKVFIQIMARREARVGAEGYLRNEKYRNFAAVGAFLESNQKERYAGWRWNRGRMTSWVRYHFSMRGCLPALVMLAGMAIVPPFQGQINGTRASVTALGGSPVFPPGPRASVTSLGPLGFTPKGSFPNCCFTFDRNHHHRVFQGNGFGLGVLPLYSMPYYYGGYGDIVNPVDDSMEQGYGPVSERQQPAGNSPAQPQYDDRLNQLEQQMDDIENATAQKATTSASEPQKPLADQPDTVLVFRDGHSVDVTNYAIVGDTLYDLSGGSRRKIALADLDLRATQKQNDDRGLDFRLPTRPLGN